VDKWAVASQRMDQLRMDGAELRQFAPPSIMTSTLGHPNNRRYQSVNAAGNDGGEDARRSRRSRCAGEHETPHASPGKDVCRRGDHAHYGAHLNSHSNSARPAPTEVGRTCYLACVVQAVHMHVNCYNGAQSLLKQRGVGGGAQRP
jgi:hypothetical protein